MHLENMSKSTLNVTKNIKHSDIYSNRSINNKKFFNKKSLYKRDYKEEENAANHNKKLRLMFDSIDTIRIYSNITMVVNRFSFKKVFNKVINSNNDINQDLILSVLKAGTNKNFKLSINFYFETFKEEIKN